MMLNFRFRFRSPQRDRQTDRARLMRIQQNVRAAVTDAEHELTGLRTRLEKARQSATFLLGGMEGGEHGEARVSEIKSVEARLLVADRRIAQLKDHIAALRRVEGAINIELMAIMSPSP